jgi:hypothetical protein
MAEWGYLVVALRECFFQMKHRLWKAMSHIGWSGIQITEVWMTLNIAEHCAQSDTTVSEISWKSQLRPP